MKTFGTIAGGAIAVLVLAAMVVGLMQLHNPSPAFACPDPEPPCPDGCHWTGNCWYVWYKTVGDCCYYSTNSPNCTPTDVLCF
ncbi:MAG: hypothetical protein ACE5OR_16920 [bacterium]